MPEPPDDLTRAQLELIYNNTSDLVFLLEVLGAGRYRIASVNPAFLAHTGKHLADVVGLSVDELYQGQHLAYVLARYDEAVAHGGPWNYETRTHDFAGQVVYLNTTLVPAYDADGNCTHLVGVSRDTTRDRLEQRALWREKRRAENYLEVAEALIVALDRDGNITMLNRKGHTLLGYPEGTLIGRSWIDTMIPPDRVEAFKQGLRHMMETGVAIRRNVNYVLTQAGERRLVSWSNALVHDDNGQPAGLLSSGEDITDRRRAEQAMIASQRVLAADEVVSAVAHDFNNALQGILGNLEIALTLTELEHGHDGADGTPIQSRLAAACKLAEDAAHRLRVLRGIGSHDSSGEREALNLHDLVEDVVAQTRPLWKDEAEREGHQIVIERQFEESQLPVVGDRGELRSVLYNIVKNAIEAINGSGSVTFQTCRRNGFATVTVTDTGMGMDGATSTRIFQPFFSTKGLESGRGLGLSASHNIVRTHGGTIRVQHSAPGLGTTIEVRLPAASAPEPADGADPGADAPTRRRVLWVDDDPQIRAMAAEYLTAMGHRGDVADGGRQALELLRRNQYSVVITDIGMPGMNGLDLAERIFTEAGIARLPVIALTGWGDSITRGRILPRNIVRVLAKPIRLEELRDVLKALPP